MLHFEAKITTQPKTGVNKTWAGAHGLPMGYPVGHPMGHPRKGWKLKFI